MTTDRCDVAVVGGGIIGMSIAYQIARRSDLSVMVLEKGLGLGEGSTGSSSAITRQRYTTIENVRVSRDGNRIWRNWSDYVQAGNPNGKFHDIGVLWMVDDSPESVAYDHERMTAEGIDVADISADDVTELFPGMSTCMVPFDLTGETEHECAPGNRFLLERDTGFFDATGALVDVAIASKKNGVDVRLNTVVTDVLTKGGRATGVVLGDGTTVSCGLVINAAGPWCNRINAMVGLEVPWHLVPTRIQVIYRDLPPEVPRPIPVTCDSAGGIYFRPEANDGQIILGSILEEDEMEEVDPDTYNKNALRSFIDTKIHALHHRIPSLPYRGIPGGMAGLYTVNRQDVLPVVGPTAIDGYAVVNGFSGHGFKESQVIASMMAQWITGERASYDTDVPMEFFSIDREPVEIAEHNVLA
jgi:glycine/D-amino acid oxidase-like deaminating enzyme